MPYKTKFRDVKVPKNSAEIEAFPKDANSLRSWGAAQYRELAKTCPVSNRCYTGAAIYAGTDMFVHDVLGHDEHRDMKYMTDGFRRAARQAGDHETAEHLLDMIDQVKLQSPMKKV